VNSDPYTPSVTTASHAATLVMTTLGWLTVVAIVAWLVWLVLRERRRS
jgi:hypothetical protein